MNKQKKKGARSAKNRKKTSTRNCTKHCRFSVDSETRKLHGSKELFKWKQFIIKSSRKKKQFFVIVLHPRRESAEDGVTKNCFFILELLILNCFHLNSSLHPCSFLVSESTLNRQCLVQFRVELCFLFLAERAPFSSPYSF